MYPSSGHLTPQLPAPPLPPATPDTSTHLLIEVRAPLASLRRRDHVRAVDDQQARLAAHPLRHLCMWSHQRFGSVIVRDQNHEAQCSMQKKPGTCHKLCVCIGSTCVWNKAARLWPTERCVNAVPHPCVHTWGCEVERMMRASRTSSTTSTIFSCSLSCTQVWGMSGRHTGSATISTPGGSIEEKREWKRGWAWGGRRMEHHRCCVLLSFYQVAMALL